jgi:hypothetical protein
MLEEYFFDRSTVCLIRGPLGSAKTQTTIYKLMKLMQEQEPNHQNIRPTRLFVIRNTYPDLITTTIKDWAAITKHIAPVKMGHPPTQMLKYRLPDGTWVECDIVFVALDREEHIRKLRGTQGTMAWLNEVKELPRAVIEMIDARLGRYPSIPLAGVTCTCPGYIVGDTNAPDEDHWYAQYERDPPAGWSFYIQPGAVLLVDGLWTINPIAENIDNLPEGYYDKLLAGKRDAWIRVNLANELGTSADGKAVWEEFDKAIHVAEFEPDPAYPVLFGCDWGLTPAMVLAQEIDGQLLVFDEIITENFSAEELAMAATQRLASEWPTLRRGHGWGDPSGVSGSQADKKTPFMVMAGNGFSIIPSSSNDFSLRRDAVGNRLRRLTYQAKPALVIHPRCIVLKKGMGGYYCYKRVRVSGDEKYHDIPTKNMYSHICEGLQYLSIGLGDGYTVMGYDSPYGEHAEPINVRSNSNGRVRRRTC